MNNFFAELSRRNVFRVAAAYVIVGWIVLQVVGLMAPSLGLPDWTLALVFVILLSAFPIAIFLTWAFEMTPEGVKKTENVEASIHSSSKSDLGLMALVSVLIVVTYLKPGEVPAPVIEEIVEAPVEDTAAPSASADQVSIAVLPFANMSGNAENEYFSDGISEEILNALAGVKSMRVAARTSAFFFKGKNQDIRTIGEALDVAHVLEGSVRRIGDRVRITAQLINVSNGYHLWSSTYDRDLTDIFAIQEEIAQAITRALKVELDIKEQETLAYHGTNNLAAYNAYLKGQENITWENLDQANRMIEHLRRAVELDPEFADAYGSLAVLLVSSHAYKPLSDMKDELVEAFSKGLALDPDQPHSLAAKAYYITLTDHDWKAAGELFERALLSGDNRVGLFYSSAYLCPLGKRNKCNDTFEVALKNDPLAYGTRWDTAINTYEMGLYEKTLEHWNIMIDISGGTNLDLCGKATALIALDRETEAADILKGLNPLGDPWDYFQCGIAFWEIGDKARFETTLQELKVRRKTEYGFGPPAATLLVLSGDYDGFLEQQRELIRSQAYSSTRLLLYPADALASDPAFTDLIKELRLDDASLAEMGLTWGEAETTQ